MNDEQFINLVDKVASPIIMNAPSSGLSWEDYVFAIGLAVRGIMTSVVGTGVITEEEVQERIGTILIAALSQNVAVIDAGSLGMTPGLHAIRKKTTH